MTDKRRLLTRDELISKIVEFNHSCEPSLLSQAAAQIQYRTPEPDGLEALRAVIDADCHDEGI